VFKGNKALGEESERLAVNFLRKNGYEIICFDYTTKLGQIDIIAKEQGFICFIEVKSRSTNKFGLGSESVLPGKQRQISKAALVFLKSNNLLGAKARFDVLSIDYSLNEGKFSLIKDAFELQGGFIY